MRGLVLVEKGTSSLGFYTAEGVHVKSIKLDTFPHEMRLSPDRRLAYITNNGSLRFTDDVLGGEVISVVDLTNLKKKEDIHLAPFRRPHGIDIDPETGYMAVTCENPDQVLLIDPENDRILRSFNTGGKTPHMVTISKGAKWLYVSNVESGNLVGIHCKTGESFSIDVGFKPQESVLTSNESTLFVGCDEYIAIIDLGKRTVIDSIPVGANRLELIDKKDLLIFSSTRNGIGFANAVTFDLIHHIDIPYKPYSIHLSEDESLAYVAAEEQGIVYTVDIHKRRIIDYFKTSPGKRPDPVMDIDLPGIRKEEYAKKIQPLPNYESLEIDTAFYKGYQVKAGDIDGDGRIDLVAVSDRLPEVVWYKNPGWEKHVLLNKTERNIDIDLYDADSDGDLDLALAYRFNSKDPEHGGYIGWLENPGRYDSLQWKLYLIDSLPTSHRIRWTDIDGDGQKELINLPLLGRGAYEPDYDVPLSAVCYYIPQDPRNDPWEKIIIDSSLHLAHGICITRWDNDLKEDLLVASMEGITLFLSEGDPVDPLWGKTLLTHGKIGQGVNAGCSEIATGQIGHYEDRILATIEPWHGNEVVVYTAPEDNWKRTLIDTSFREGHAIACADLNYDGYDEIIAGYRGEGYDLYIYQYDPIARNWERTSLDHGGISVAGLVIFDHNMDGVPDIAACGSFTRNLKIYTGNY
jgi:DNA-binding beta-propeller fold protein YncE